MQCTFAVQLTLQNMNKAQLKRQESLAKMHKLISDIEKAQEAANQFIDCEDGGTCNCDTVTIRLTGFTPNEIKELQQNCPLVGDKLTSRIFKGCRWLHFKLSGQGNRRTKMAQEAYKSLESAGYDVSIYYQMD